MSLSGNRKKLLQYSLAQIESCIEQGSFGRALAHFCIVFKLQPTAKDELKETFLLAVSKHTAYLESEERWSELFDCYEELLKAYYSCEELHHSLGSLLFRHGHVKEAASSIRKALNINPNFTAARLSLDGLRTSLLERWHFQMLNDSSRNKAFHDAITAAVRNGHKSVLDIGAGTGLLSLFALSAGAERVYSCEVSPTSCEMAETVFEENGFGTKCRLVNKHSTELTIPEDLEEQVTLVMTETFDSGLFGEHVLKSLDHAWSRLLDRESCAHGNIRAEVIPGKAEVFACLIESEWIRTGTRVDSLVVRDILKIQNVELVSEENSQDPYSTERLSRIKHGYRSLSDPTIIMTVDFNNCEEIRRLLNGAEWIEELCCNQSGALDAVCVWFRLKVGDAWLDTGPETESCWEQAIYLGPCIEVAAGDLVKLLLHCKGHLTISCSSEMLGKAPSSPQCQILLPSDVVRAINDQACAAAHLAQGAQLRELSNTAKILDLSHVPILGLLLLRDQPSRKLTWVSSPGSESFFSSFVRHHSLEKSVCLAPELESVSVQCSQEYDVLIFSAFEPSGLLRHQLFEDVALLRKSCLTADAIILPCALTVRALLVESVALEEQSRLVDDDRTLGFKVAECINIFQVRTQQDINMATIPHRPLSDVFTLFEINFADVGLDLPEVSSVRSVQMLESGRISGCFYWFEEESPIGHVINSNSKETAYSQAAVMFREPIIVPRETYVVVGSSCVEGNIDIWLDVVKK